MSTKCFMCDESINTLSINDLCDDHFKQYHKDNDHYQEVDEDSFGIDNFYGDESNE